MVCVLGIDESLKSAVSQGCFSEGLTGGRKNFDLLIILRKVEVGVRRSQDC